MTNNTQYKNIDKYDLLYNAIVSKNIAFFFDFTQLETELNTIAVIFDTLLSHAANINKLDEFIEILNESIDYVRDYTNDKNQYSDINHFDDIR